MFIFYKKSTVFCKCSLLLAAMCFHIFTCSYPNNSNRVISCQEEVDLDFFSATGDTASLFSKLDYTETSCGRDALKAILTNPLSNVEELKARQESIKKIIAEPLLFNQLNNELQDFKKGEPALRSFQEPEDPIRKAALEEFFFKNSALKKYNNSAPALNAGQFLQIINLSSPLLEHLVLHFLISDAIKKKFNIGCCGSDHTHSHGTKHHHTHATSITKVLYHAYNITHLLIHCLGVKELIGHVYQKINLIKELQKKLIAVSTSIKSLKNIYTIISSHPTIYQSLPHYSYLKKLFVETEETETKITSKFDQLCSLLSKKTFAGNASCFSNYGTILSANFKIKKLQKELSDGLKAIGEIDAFISIAKLYNQSQEVGLKYSFAHYLGSIKATVNTQGFWHPLMSNALPNSDHFNLGMSNPAHVVITGPNAAGKSTKLKSVALLIILGQTFTIVPATAFEFTPFSRISTFIKHTDNLNTGDSLFTSELNKVNNLLTYLKNLPENKFCFIIFDELFTSTSFEYGQKSAFKLMDYISNFKNTASITATHFPLLTTLSDTKPEKFINYNAQVLKNEEGNLQFVFKEGISEEKDAFTVLNMRNIEFDWNN